LNENIDPSKLGEFSFASRKLPEYMCHHLVRCTSCSLVYADRPPAEGELAHAYHVAEYDSSEEANDAAAAYILAIGSTLDRLASRRSALEIGTGTGVFLDHLAKQGFETLVGVEPSSAAIAAAPEKRRAWIREGMFEERNFEAESFDLICCFMTMEHVRDPQEIASAAFRLLRPGGAFVTVTHDYQGAVNRLLGKRSPIIDIEHLQLFSKPSLVRLFEGSGFEEVATRGFMNRYPLQYWTKLVPLPAPLKTAALGVLKKTGMGGIKFGFNVGNVIASGFKPRTKPLD
jgi:SAM-dependent methyltransferase